MILTWLQVLKTGFHVTRHTFNPPTYRCAYQVGVHGVGGAVGAVQGEAEGVGLAGVVLGLLSDLQGPATRP